MKNKIIAGLLSTALLLNPLAAHADEAVHLNGKLVDGRVFMPLRAAGDQIGAVTTWNQKTKAATVKKDGKVLEVKLGEYVKMFDNRVYVQFREFNETFFEQDHIVWHPTDLVASSEHITVDIGTLDNAQAFKLVKPLFSKHEDSKEYFEDKDNSYYGLSISYSGTDKAVVTVSTGQKDEYGRYIFICSYKVNVSKYSSGWKVVSYNYTKTEIPDWVYS
ncbi:stalk domain-containing protein [Paenibacillus sp. Z3-2]